MSNQDNQISQEIIDVFKEIHRDIYKVEYEGKEFLYRKISRAEYLSLTEVLETDEELEEHTVMNCVLHPASYNPDDYLPGTTTALSETILTTSNMYPEQMDSLLEQFNSQMESLDYQIDLIIREVFPEFTLEEMYLWDSEKTLFYYSRALWVLQNLRGIPLQVYNKEEYLSQNFENESYSNEGFSGINQEQYSNHMQSNPNPNRDIVFDDFEKPSISDDYYESEYENEEEYNPSMDNESQRREESDELTEEEVRARLKKIKIDDNQLLAMFGQGSQHSQRSAPTSITPIGTPLPESSWTKGSDDLLGENNYYDRRK